MIRLTGLFLVALALGCGGGGNGNYRIPTGDNVKPFVAPERAELEEIDDGWDTDSDAEGATEMDVDAESSADPAPAPAAAPAKAKPARPAVKPAKGSN